jgi:carbonic anhydrase
MTIEELLSKNRAYAASDPAIPSAVEPRLGLAVVTCMDARIEPLAALGLDLGDAHVLRNAGARVTPDVIRSLAVSQQVLNTRLVVLMAHTRCGMIGLNPERQLTAWQAGVEPPMDWRTVQDLGQDVAADLAVLRASPWIRRDATLLGAVFDVDSGLMRLVAQR